MHACQLQHCNMKTLLSEFLKQLKTDNTTSQHIIIINIHTILSSLHYHCPLVAEPGSTDHNDWIWTTLHSLFHRFRLYEALERALGLCWQCVKLPAAKILKYVLNNTNFTVTCAEPNSRVRMECTCISHQIYEYETRWRFKIALWQCSCATVESRNYQSLRNIMLMLIHLLKKTDVSF